ncbi:TPA: hypothetical protein QCI27_000878 [Enterobacter roggenkampii]|nr:hypothetical protein [Enterobacter roggenkampii MGH 34]HDR2480792.1 hypothetical protein [Enterobacter roggenkampii]
MSTSIYEVLNQKRNGQAILNRLHWIEGQLMWVGEFNRKDLVTRFAISPQQASADIALYKEFAPNNMEFNNRSKVFFIVDSFRAMFEHDGIHWLEQEQHNDPDKALELVHIIGIPQKMDPHIFRTLNRCRKYEIPVCVEIGNFSAAETTLDLICPHSIVVTPIRWHVRAWSNKNQKFVDVPISRIRSAEPSTANEWVSKQADREWLEHLPIILTPADNLNDGQKKMVYKSYGMTDGIVQISTRICLIYYTLASMQLLNAVREHKGQALDPKLNIQVLNYKELLPLVKRSSSFNWKNRLSMYSDIQEMMQLVENSHGKFIEFPSSKLPVWLGSGYAKISASHGAELCKLNGIYSTSLSPLEYKISSLKPSFYPILLSFSGKGEDAIDTAKNMSTNSDYAGVITCKYNAEAVMQLSSLPCSQLSSDFPDRDDRFVNIRSILTLTALTEKYTHQQFKIALSKLDFQACAQKAEMMGTFAAERFIEDFSWQTKQLIIVGKGYDNPLKHVWTSILSEAGIMTPTWVDIKDFTHGDYRHASLYHNHIFLLIDQPEINFYCDIFEERFSQILPVERIKLTGKYREQFWLNLFTSLYFTHRLTYEQGHDGKRPPKNELVHSWRGWGQLHTE